MKSIRDWRLEAGLTQPDVERRTGIGQRYISAFERGKLKPTVEQLRKLASCYHAGLGDLLGLYEGVKLKGSYDPIERITQKGDLPNSLRAVRIRSGLTIRETASALGVMPTTIEHYEQGALTPSLEALKALIKLYGSTVDGAMDTSAEWAKIMEASIWLYVEGIKGDKEKLLDATRVLSEIMEGKAKE